MPATERCLEQLDQSVEEQELPKLLSLVMSDSSAQDAATKARIVKHMNDQHQDSVRQHSFTLAASGHD
jgi:Trp operon repressor